MSSIFIGFNRTKAVTQTSRKQYQVWSTSYKYTSQTTRTLGSISNIHGCEDLEKDIPVCLKYPCNLVVVFMWHHMAIYNWVNIGSGNGLLPGGTKPLPEPVLIYHQSVILQEIPQPSITEISWKITDFKFHSNLPGANELTQKLMVV